MTGGEQGKADEVVNPGTQLLCYCHIFNHATVPELCNICCVIFKVQGRSVDNTWDVRKKENEDRMRKRRVNYK